MAVNFRCNAPTIQLERRGSHLWIHLSFDNVAEAKKYFTELEEKLETETEGSISLSFVSDGPVSKQ